MKRAKYESIVSPCEFGKRQTMLELTKWNLQNNVRMLIGDRNQIHFHRISFVTDNLYDVSRNLRKLSFSSWDALATKNVRDLICRG